PPRELAGVHQEREGDHLPGGDRPPLREHLPPGQHRLPAGPKINVGPGEGSVHRRRRGEQGTEPRAAREVEGVSVRRSRRAPAPSPRRGISDFLIHISWVRRGGVLSQFCRRVTLTSRTLITTCVEPPS